MCSNIHSFKQQQWVTEFLFVSQNNKDILLELQLLASDDSTVFSSLQNDSLHTICVEKFYWLKYFRFYKFSQVLFVGWIGGYLQSLTVSFEGISSILQPTRVQPFTKPKLKNTKLVFNVSYLVLLFINIQYSSFIIIISTDKWRISCLQRI